MSRRTIAATLFDEEYDAARVLADKHNIAISAWFRSIVVDALVDEGYTNAVQRGTPRGRPKNGEGIQTSRGTTHRDYQGDNVVGPRPSMGVGEA